jgi:hypothetical protein
MDSAFLDGLIDKGDSRGNQLLGGFLVPFMNGLAELFDLSAKSRLILSVDGVPADAAAPLAERGIVMSHIRLLVFGAYDRICGRQSQTRVEVRRG